MYYECHITIKLGPVSPQPLIEALNNWHYSCIAGDPNLGPDTYQYATRHASASTRLSTVIESMNSIAALLTSQGHTVVREKVELVVYDTKGKNENTILGY